MRDARALCFEVRDGASERDWVRAHAALTRLARERAAADAEEGRWLLVAWRSGVHVFLGFGSFSEYVERLLGYSPRATREKLRVAEALEALPQSARALEQGTLSWCAARELTRVATGDTEAAWLQAAHGKTTRELERLVAGRQPGELPLPTKPQPPRRHVLRFDVTPETFATFREATRSLRCAAGEHLDDDALLLLMARQVLGAPPDERSSYRLSFHICSHCGQGSQLAAGELVPVGPEILGMAACDGEQLGAPVSPANENSLVETPGAAAALVTSASSECLTNHATHENHTTHVGRERHEGRKNPTTRDSHESATAHVGRASPTTDEKPATPERLATHAGRTRQAIPPALRRAVLARDLHRCQVPGCSHGHFVDVHHIRPRSEGGRNTLENLVTLCTAHHRAIHRGELIIEGAGAKRVFRHADGTPYGHPLKAEAAETAEVHTKLFSALRHLGFRECEVRTVLAELRADASLREVPLEHLLREALRRIRPARSG